MSENKKEKYISNQNKCGLKVDDLVKVIRIAKTDENGWSNAWISEMDNMIGQLFKINRLGSEGQGILLDNSFYLPYFVLEPAFKSDKVLKCPMCGKSMCVMDKMDEKWNDKKNDVSIKCRSIIFEYNCSNPECGMSGYYPFEVSEVPDGESFFE